MVQCTSGEQLVQTLLFKSGRLGHVYAPCFFIFHEQVKGYSTAIARNLSNWTHGNGQARFSCEQHQDPISNSRVQFILLIPVYTIGFADHSSSFITVHMLQRFLSSLSLQSQRDANIPLAWELSPGMEHFGITADLLNSLC